MTDRRMASVTPSVLAPGLDKHAHAAARPEYRTVQCHGHVRWFRVAEVHDFRSALIDAPDEEPQLAKLPNWNSAIWSRGDKVYLALTTADPDKLTGCL